MPNRLVCNVLAKAMAPSSSRTTSNIMCGPSATGDVLVKI